MSDRKPTSGRVVIANANDWKGYRKNVNPLASLKPECDMSQWLKDQVQEFGVRFAPLFSSRIGRESLWLIAECDEWASKMHAVTGVNIWRTWLDDVYDKATTTPFCNSDVMRGAMRGAYELACQGYTPIQIMTRASYWW